MCDENIVISETIIEKETNVNNFINRVNELWATVKDINYDNTDKKEAEMVFQQIKKDYTDVNVVCPVVIQLMVLERRYSSKALKKALGVKIKTTEDFLNLQANYIMYILKEDNPKLTQASLFQHKAEILQRLIEEEKSFKLAEDEYQKVLAQQEEEEKIRIRESIKNKLLRKV